MKPTVLLLILQRNICAAAYRAPELFYKRGNKTLHSPGSASGCCYWGENQRVSVAVVQDAYRIFKVSYAVLLKSNKQEGQAEKQIRKLDND